MVWVSLKLCPLSRQKLRTKISLQLTLRPSRLVCYIISEKVKLLKIKLIKGTKKSQNNSATFSYFFLRLFRIFTFCDFFVPILRLFRTLTNFATFSYFRSIILRLFRIFNNICAIFSYFCILRLFRTNSATFSDLFCDFFVP